MIATFDIENLKKEKGGDYKPILDATGRYFTIGCVMKEDGRSRTFRDRREMWKYIIELGIREYRRGKKLAIYSHNLAYDFWQIADLKDRDLRIYSESNPMLAGYYTNTEKIFYKEEDFERWKNYAKNNRIQYEVVREDDLIKARYKKEIIKFGDSMSLFNMSLKRVGKLIGHEKTEMPLDIGSKLTEEKLRKLEEYCLNDCMVTLKAIKYLKDKLEEEGIFIKNLYTISQVAINYVINRLRKGENDHILRRLRDNSISEMTHKTRYREEIHSAYRGGYVRVWKTGFIENVSTIDFTSLYPYSAMMIRFPDLRTERKIYQPLKVYDLMSLLENIGISRCIVRNKSNKLGILQIRMDERSYVPTEGKYMLGTWTNEELKEAVNEGYEILDIEWSILWDEGKNPLLQIFNETYRLRKQSKNEFDNYFYKMIMNCGIGKFGQTKLNQEIIIDSCEKIYDYLERGYKLLKGIEKSEDLMYVKKDINKEYVKKYYAPIIPTLINAYARIIMYKEYKKVPIESLIYTDTDSIITIGDWRSRYKIGYGIGEFKVDKDIIDGSELIGKSAVIWGTKAKAIGNNIALSGVHKSELNIENFRKGKVNSKKMLGLNTQDGKTGQFVIEERDLAKQEEEYWKGENILKEQKIYFDKDIEDITYFTDALKKIGFMY